MWQKSKNVYHLGQSILGKYLYRVSTDGLTIIGVTGTDGKTTTSSLIYHILKESGHNAALISTVSAIIGGKTYDTGFHVTTPSPMNMQKYLKKVKESGATHVVLEVTSHALDQNRVYGIPLTVGVLTNVTPEHLDYHKTYASYVAVKAKLLLAAKIAIYNADDQSYEHIRKILEERGYFGRQLTYGLHTNADVTAKSHAFKTKLLGDFNRSNILAAFAACEVIGVNKKDIGRGIASFTSPIGRMEIVHEDEFTVMIDFAHTPNSIRNVLQTVKEELKPRRIIHVFGSAGERDVQKRVAMGEASAAFADAIVLTAEDPRSESVEEINTSIKTGITKLLEHEDRDVELFEIPERRQAIQEAIKMAKTGDLVIITGKGHERSMNLGRGEEPWNEHEAVREALKSNN